MNLIKSAIPRALAVMFMALPAVFPASAQQQPPQLEQPSISIRGNQALPKTLYIAPWKRLGSPLEGTPFEGRVGDSLEPLERDLFRKQLELIEEGYSVDTVPTK